MNWLITGGCGFIGTSLIARLAPASQHAIRVVDNLSVGSRDDLARVVGFGETDGSSGDDLPAWEGGKTALVVGDILDQGLALRVAEGAEVIVHLAANTGVAPSVEDPRSDCVTNVLGTFNYLEAARANRVPRFVFASSGAPVGECEPPIHEEKVPHPVSPYGASKLAGEAYCSAYFRTFGIDTVALRFGNVYGPRSSHKASVVAKFIRQALHGEVLEIYGDGSQTRDFIFIDDLTDAIVRAAESEGVGGEIFQIATNSETTLNTLVSDLLATFERHGLQTPRVRHGSWRLGDVHRNFSDVSKARQLLGWWPRTSLETGLGETLDWYLSQNRDRLPAASPERERRSN